MDHGDVSLMQFDKTLRKRISKGWPADWTPSTESPSVAPLGGGDLIGIYRALWEGEQDRWDEAKSMLSQVVNNCAVPQLRGSALRFLIQRTYSETLSLYGTKSNVAATKLEAECRRFCDRALQEFREYPWAIGLTFVARVALGVIDSLAGDLETSGMHLSLAMKDFDRDPSMCEQGAPINVGYMFLTLGQNAQDSGNAVQAISYFREAVRKFDDDELRALSYSFLASTLLDTGLESRARRAAKNGLREATRLQVRTNVIDDLKCNLAAAEIALGNIRTGTKLLEDVLVAGVDEGKREFARESLQKLHSATP